MESKNYIVVKLISNYEGKKYEDGTFKLFIHPGDELPKGYSEDELVFLFKKGFIKEDKTQKQTTGKTKLPSLAKELNISNKDLLKICNVELIRKVKMLSWLNSEEVEKIKGCVN